MNAAFQVSFTICLRASKFFIMALGRVHLLLHTCIISMASVSEELITVQFLFSFSIRKLYLCIWLNKLMDMITRICNSCPIDTLFSVKLRRINQFVFPILFTFSIYTNMDVVTYVCLWKKDARQYKTREIPGTSLLGPPTGRYPGPTGCKGGPRPPICHIYAQSD